MESSSAMSPARVVLEGGAPPPHAGDPPDSIAGELALDTALVLTPLGGLGEIGMNCMALDQSSGGQRERIVIDCGATFPLDDEGVDLVHPRFDALLDGTPTRALVVTHGHEDHIGAIPHLVEALAKYGAEPLEVWAPRYALELCRHRLDDAGAHPGSFRLRSTTPGRPIELGGFSVEPVRVTHSIVDATALIIGTRAGTVVHTGDFKLDPEPYDGEPTDESRFARAGDDGVALLLSDSTNVFHGGSAGAERNVALALEAIITRAERRVVVGLFASNVHRLCALGEIARRTGRRLCLLGRSLCRHADVARAVGKLDWPSDLVVAPEIAATLPRTAVLFLATGTQAEPRGALARLASGQHGDVRLEPGDLVVLSSRTIPGSERLVHDMCDRFLRSGVELCTAANEPAIHVSGHAHRGEQARMIELTRPRAFVPLHGTVYHLHEHAKLAQTLGVPDSLVLVDGERAALAPDGLARLSSVTSGKVAIAGGRAIPEQALRERRKLAKSGVVFVALSYHVDGAIEVGASATGIGDEQLVIEAAVSAARAAARGLESRAHVEAIEGVRRAVRQRLSERTGQRPMIEVQLTRRGQP